MFQRFNVHVPQCDALAGGVAGLAGGHDYNIGLASVFNVWKYLQYIMFVGICKKTA